MSTPSKPSRADEGAPSRRTVLRGAAVAGGLVWTAPLVQVVTPPASAGTPAPDDLSFVALVLKRDKISYRVKYEAGEDTPEIGMTFALGDCAWPGGNGNAAGATVDNVVKRAAFTLNGFELTLFDGVDLDDWLVKQGRCCITESGARSAGYLVSRSGSTYVFPPAPNQPPCKVVTATASPTATAEPVTTSTSTATTTATTTVTTSD